MVPQRSARWEIETFVRHLHDEYQHRVIDVRERLNYFLEHPDYRREFQKKSSPISFMRTPDFIRYRGLRAAFSRFLEKVFEATTAAMAALDKDSATEWKHNVFPHDGQHVTVYFFCASIFEGYQIEVWWFLHHKPMGGVAEGYSVKIYGMQHNGHTSTFPHLPITASRDASGVFLADDFTGVIGEGELKGIREGIIILAQKLREKFKLAAAA